MKDKKTPAKQPRDSLPWRSLEQQVVRAQKHIAQASQRGDRQTMYDLQQRLMESEAARLLAVRRVTGENQGKDTAGVDGIKSLNPGERLAMASAIHPKNWNEQPPMPVRRVWVPKPGTAERRPLAILSMIDRCKQALVKLALEPEWEVRFEAHSYGFRPGRGAHDAIAAIVVAIERQPVYVFDADIEAAFDHVNHAALLDKLQTYPALRQAIAAWLTAGVMDGASFSLSATGIAQGGVLSPLLMNVALHGMEAVVTNGVANGRGSVQPLLVRYADDFVMLHPDLKELQQAARRIKNWLARLGLHLHADKTRITHTLTPYQGKVGFDFLGFNIRQEAVEKIPTEGKGGERSPRATARVPTPHPLHPRPYYEYGGEVERVHSRGGGSVGSGGDPRGRPRLPKVSGGEPGPSLVNTPGVKTIIAPSQEANKRHLAAIEQRLQKLQMAPQARVIEELNPLIVGWVAYYNGVVPAATMSRYDELIEQRLISWAGKRHPGKAREWLLNRYWQHAGKRGRVFATHDGAQLRPYGQMSILGIV